MITPWASNLHQNFLLRTGIRPVLAKSCDKLVHMTQSICAIATMAAAMRYGLVHQTASFKAWKVSSTASRFLAADMSISRKPRINCRKSWEYIRINIKKKESIKEQKTHTTKFKHTKQREESRRPPVDDFQDRSISFGAVRLEFWRCKNSSRINQNQITSDDYLSYLCSLSSQVFATELIWLTLDLIRNRNIEASCYASNKVLRTSHDPKKILPLWGWRPSTRREHSPDEQFEDNPSMGE